VKEKRSSSLPAKLRTQHPALKAVSMAERVGFEPTVPLLRRMLSKHVDSTTLAPLRAHTKRGIVALQSGMRQGATDVSEVYLTLERAFPILVFGIGGTE
jgi:hypothetical protein